MKPLGPMEWMLPIFLSLCCLAEAGEIRGWVLSTEGRPIANAEILTKKLEGQVRQAVWTQPDGHYVVRDLGEGVYSLTVTGPGGHQVVHRIVVIGTPDSSIRMDFRLALLLSEEVSPQEEQRPPLPVYTPDLNAVRRRLMEERGAEPQPLSEFLPEQNYFGAEFGSPLKEFYPLASRPIASQWRSAISDAFQNSVLNARSFFTRGRLPSARVNQYNVSSGGPLASERLFVTAQFGRLWDSGEVNGNVQVPKQQERIPLTNDPQARSVIAAILEAYRSGLPNFPASANISEHQRNVSAPHKIDNKDGLLRLDIPFGMNNSLASLFSINDHAEDPLELVIGQNPQTNVRTLAIHASLTHNFSPSAVGRIGFHFDRLAASLSPTEEFLHLFDSQGIATSVPDVDFQADSLEDIGPGTPFPRRQVQNRFQLYGDATRPFGRHTLKIGGGMARVQVNDLQSDHARGTLVFAADFGHSEIENFLLGRPALWTVSSGDFYRGFRNWEHFFYLGDQIRLTPRLNLNLGLRYELETSPTEVNGRTEAGYSTDLTNFAPRIGFAWYPTRANLTLRGGYGISYGIIFPATYQFACFNPPEIRVTELPAPDLASLFFPPAPQGRYALRRISPDLVTPYSHQYSLSVERDMPGSFFLRLSYTGSRSFHLFTQSITNRARPLSGIPLTTETVNARRPDSRYTSMAEVESNSIAYYDAAQVSLQKRLS
ncbi:MAG: TonB-dependent receptor, partial [Acidobacteria bacterium]|nr:TonB-dependent receptor [Acidobacteriota bacterium]